MTTPTSPVDRVVMRRTYQWAEREIRPFVDAIVRIRLRERPSYLLSGDVLTKIDDGLTATEIEFVAFCEDEIRDIITRAERMAGVAL